MSLLAPECASVGAYALVATVTNVGETALPASVVVGFHEGAPPKGTKLGEASITIPLYSAQSQKVKLAIAMPDQAITSGTKPVYEMVDDTKTPHPSWHPCRTDDDTSPAVSGACHH